jgi:hypothetical protein
MNLEDTVRAVICSPKVRENIEKLSGVKKVVLSYNLVDTTFGDTITVIASIPGVQIFEFTLRQFSGCAQFLESLHTFIPDEFRRKGIGTYLQSIKEEIGVEFGSNSLICQVSKLNAVQLRILEKEGWKKITETKYVCIMEKVLPYEEFF